MDQAVVAEAREYIAMGAKINRGDVVVDVGANIGAFSQIAAELTSSDVQLLCFEPEPTLFAKLQRNFATTPRLAASSHHLYPLALSSDDQAGKELDFYFFRRFPTDSTLNLESKLLEFQGWFQAKAIMLERTLSRVPMGTRVGSLARRGIEKYCRADNRIAVAIALKAAGMECSRAKLDTLSNVVTQRGLTRIDLLKIDVEGAELDVLRGAFAVLPMVKQVVLETYDTHNRANEIEALLVQAGFSSVKRFAPEAAIRQQTPQTLMLATREVSRSHASLN